MNCNSPSLLLEDDSVKSIAELVGDVNRVLVRTGDGMNRVEPARQPAELAKCPQHFSRQSSPYLPVRLALKIPARLR